MGAITTDAVQARINEIECELYAPGNYRATLLVGDLTPDHEQQHLAQEQRRAGLIEELNRLRKRQVDEANARFGSLAPIEGQRLSTGHLPRPEPPDPDVDTWKTVGARDRTYDPLRRFVEDDLGEEWRE
jgi:hypothetical protein